MVLVSLTNRQVALVVEYGPDDILDAMKNGQMSVVIGWLDQWLESRGV